MVSNIGQKIRALRKEKGITLSELSTATDLSIGLLSNLERNMSSPTLENIQRICEALNHSLITLLENNSMPTRVVRANERNIVFDEEKKLRYESVIFGPNCLDGLFITLEPNCHIDREWTHGYDELGLVLEGSMLITMEGTQLLMEKGDSAYIKAQTNHGLGNPSDLPCISYWVRQPSIDHV
ncbi:XRE family transcriptional regulator [Bengtsoniella intestinalis]|uniref:helix-turn-helix domain-containing protein n=1 Tax=Bengtsoniella intestinalis TaxID=3073143 RepID=UPI00391FB4F0